MKHYYAKSADELASEVRLLDIKRALIVAELQHHQERAALDAAKVASILTKFVTTNRAEISNV